MLPKRKKITKTTKKKKPREKTNENFKVKLRVAENLLGRNLTKEEIRILRDLESRPTSDLLAIVKSKKISAALPWVMEILLTKKGKYHLVMAALSALRGIMGILGEAQKTAVLKYLTKIFADPNKKAFFREQALDVLVEVAPEFFRKHVNFFINTVSKAKGNEILKSDVIDAIRECECKNPMVERFLKNSFNDKTLRDNALLTLIKLGYLDDVKQIVLELLESNNLADLRVAAIAIKIGKLKEFLPRVIKAYYTRREPYFKNFIIKVIAHLGVVNKEVRDIIIDGFKGGNESKRAAMFAVLQLKLFDEQILSILKNLIKDKTVGKEAAITLGQILRERGKWSKLSAEERRALKEYMFEKLSYESKIKYMEKKLGIKLNVNERKDLISILKEGALNKNISELSNNVIKLLLPLFYKIPLRKILWVNKIKDPKILRNCMILTMNVANSYSIETLSEAINAYAKGKFKEWKFKDLKGVPENIADLWKRDFAKQVKIKPYYRIRKVVLSIYRLLNRKIVLEILNLNKRSIESFAKMTSPKDPQKVKDGLRNLKKAFEFFEKLKALGARELIKHDINKLRKDVLLNLEKLRRAFINLNLKNYAKDVKKFQDSVPKILDAKISVTGSFPDLLFTGKGATFETCISPKATHASGLVGIIALPFIKNIIVKNRKGATIARITIALAKENGKLVLCKTSRLVGNADAFLELNNFVKEYAKMLGLPLRTLRENTKFLSTDKKCMFYSDFLVDEKKF